MFPFTAVLGQDELKNCLMLCAVDPEISGVLALGDRGTAKTTTIRALGHLLSAHGVEMPVAELPLGAAEDRVVGSLDVDRALRGEMVFAPGILAEAHGGILYIDEVNLLDDFLVDLLLDVSASGVNRVERDGLSHVHPARFVLVGSGNPEEGELRPRCRTDSASPPRSAPSATCVCVERSSSVGWSTTPTRRGSPRCTRTARPGSPNASSVRGRGSGTSRSRSACSTVSSTSAWSPAPWAIAPTSSWPGPHGRWQRWPAVTRRRNGDRRRAGRRPRAAAPYAGPTG